MITKQRPITMEPEDIIRQLKAENARLREALHACVEAIDEEVQADGNEHPVVQDHKRTADRALAALAETAK